jgi:hypothetical protein
MTIEVTREEERGREGGKRRKKVTPSIISFLFVVEPLTLDRTLDILLLFFEREIKTSSY